MSVAALGQHLARVIRAHQLAAYVVIAYGLSWGYWVPLVVTSHLVTVGGGTTQFPGLLGPMLAALLVTAVSDGRAGVRELVGRMFRWRVPVRWWLLAVGSPLVLVAAALAVMALRSTAPDLADFGRMGGLPQWGVLFVWAMFVVVNGLGEETGWRGFVYPRLRRDRGWLATTLLVTPIWATWHLPLFFLLQNYRDLGPVGVPGFLIGLTCGSIVLGWLYESAGCSILIVAVWHGTYNLTSATAAGHGLVAATVSTGVSLAAVALVITTRRRMHRPSAASGGRRPDSPGGSLGGERHVRVGLRQR